jgi:thioredoxin 1
MSYATAVTDATFDAAVRHSPRPVIVEYWAPWCGPCRQLGPVLEAIAADYAGQVDLVTVNSDENWQTVQRYRVLHVPTVHVFTGGELVRQVVGARSKPALLREFADVFAGSGGARTS